MRCRGKAADVIDWAQDADLKELQDQRGCCVLKGVRGVGFRVWGLGFRGLGFRV